MRVTGTGYFYFTFDVGFAIELAAVERRVAEGSLGQTFKRPRRAPEASLLPRHATRLLQRGSGIAVAHVESLPDQPIRSRLSFYAANAPRTEIRLLPRD